MANTILKPSINRIYKITEFDLLRTSIKMGNMYICLDSQKMYYDKGNTVDDRTVYNYVSVRTTNDLRYNIVPDYGKSYYCWEDNSLWIWMNKWECLYGETTYPSAYYYDGIPTTTNPRSLNEIYRNDMPNLPADDNGLLKDGSVVIRDRNRLIKGKIYIEDTNDNLIISSYLGGGIRLLPNGLMTTDGELLITDETITEGGIDKTIPVATLRARLSLLNNEMYVDFSEHPEEDESDYPNTSHIYKVFHEGNLDTSAIKIMTPLQIYNKLLDDSLPEPFNFNVAYLNGHPYSDFAFTEHTHTSDDITDFTTKVDKSAGNAVKNIFNTMTGEGITGSYNTVTDVLRLTANDFKLTFGGGVSGSGTVNKLTNTTIELSVDPSKHNHTNYEDTLTSLQNQINAIVIDTSTTYTKDIIDRKIDEVTPSATPIEGKALLVNSEGVLPGVVTSAKQLNHYINLNLTGPVTGSARFNGSESNIEITTTLDTSTGVLADLINSKLNSLGYITTIGDGNSTTFTITHNLNSQNIIVQFRDTTTNSEVYLSNTIIDNNIIQIQTSTVLTTNQIKVYIYNIK